MFPDFLQARCQLSTPALFSNASTIIIGVSRKMFPYIFVATRLFLLRPSPVRHTYPFSNASTIIIGVSPKMFPTFFFNSPPTQHTDPFFKCFYYYYRRLAENVSLHFCCNPPSFLLRPPSVRYICLFSEAPTIIIGRSPKMFPAFFFSRCLNFSERRLAIPSYLSINGLDRPRLAIATQSQLPGQRLLSSFIKRGGAWGSDETYPLQGWDAWTLPRAPKQNLASVDLPPVYCSGFLRLSAIIIAELS